jgi:RimJ/RimL family protein N-acetyltransferase
MKLGVIGGLGPSEARQLHILGDGTRIEVRGIRPCDRDALRAAFQSLSPQSRYQRFLAQVNDLSDRTWRYLCEVDGRAHVALVALTAEAGGPVGVARFIRQAGDRATAEVAVTITDAHQRRGVGTLLLGLLVDAARERGITTLRAYALPSNEAIRRLMARHGALSWRHHGEEDELTLQLRPFTTPPSRACRCRPPRAASRPSSGPRRPPSTRRRGARRRRA